MFSITTVRRAVRMLPGALLLLLSACAEDALEPPEVEKKPQELEIHGDVRIDEYYWLRERENPAVIEFLEAENGYVDATLADSKGLLERLFEEMKARIKPDDMTAPYRHGDYYYYRRYAEGLEYPMYYRRKGSMDAEEELLLDVNALAGDADYYSLVGFTVSPDHKLAGFGVDTAGRRLYTLKFMDLETGKMLPDEFPNVTSNFQWAADNKTIVYSRQHPDTLRWQWVYRAKLGGGEPELIFEETDETFSTYVDKSLSGKFIYIVSDSTTSSEVQFIPADETGEAPQLFLARENQHEYSVADGGDRFYVTSNENAVNFQVFEVPLDDTRKASWKLIVPHRDEVFVQNAAALAGHLVVQGRRAGLRYTEVMDRETGDVRSLDFGEETFVARSRDNFEYNTDIIRFEYESMTTPESIIDIDLVTHHKTVIKEKDVPGSFDKNDYHTERLFATAGDGTQVPVSLVYRKGVQLDGNNPLLLHGYGSYGSTYDPYFSTTRLSLLDRGFVVGIAHIRGGAEMGRKWYLDGRQFNKMNTFTDYVDVSKFLIEQGYTSPEHLYAEGASAGGLLMGAVMNMAPELYNGALVGVPFVDVITTMLDESIPLTAGEWEEWGDPREKDFYEYMLAYSPYDQIKAQDYPNMLVTTGLHDSQVQYWEPAKYVARLRDHKTDDKLLLLKTDMSAGHSGKTGRYQYLEDIALEFGFLMMLEGISE